MPISSPTFKPSNVSVDIINAENPLITNLSISSIDTEFSHALQSGIKGLIIRNRNKVDTKIAFASGESATNYITLRGGSVLSLMDLDFTSKTIYVQSGTISILEILELYT